MAKQFVWGNGFALPRLFSRPQEGSGEECGRVSDWGFSEIRQLGLNHYTTTSKTLLKFFQRQKFGLPVIFGTQGSMVNIKSFQFFSLLFKSYREGKMTAEFFPKQNFLFQRPVILKSPFNRNDCEKILFKR